MRTLIAVTAILNAAAWGQNDAKDLYTTKCAVCHGPDGAGKTVMGKKLKIEDIHVVVTKHSAEEMIGVVEKGKAPGMKAYGKDLTKDQIKGVVDYFRSLAK
jgi:mono/diheme cytochrome c family protein